MRTSLASRLPGVYFETEPVRLPAELPRMDVAAFVGFAASGPLHTPVAVESVGRFRDVFGRGLTLAWDEERGETVSAWLAPAVEAFFRNGGRRCWVVRAADERAARTLEFPVPGLVTPAGEAMSARARSPGAWAAGLELGTVMRRERFALAPDSGAVGFTDGRWRLSLARSPRTLAVGDLFEIVFEDLEIVLFLFVDSVEAEDDGRLTAYGEHAFWRGQPAAASPDTGEELPLGAENPTLEPLGVGDVAMLEGDAGTSPALSPTAVHRLTFDVLAWSGSKIERRLSDLAFSAEHPRFWAALPADGDLFRAELGRARRAASLEEQLLRAEANLPRFPFAGPAAPPSLTLPSGMGTRPELPSAAAPDLPAGLTSLEIDGLADFEHRLFLDEGLARSSTGSLLAAAEHRYTGGFRSPDAEPLRGLHGLLPVGEVSLIAVPDAVHRPWTRLPPEVPPLLGAPRLDPVGEPDDVGRTLLSWTPVPRAVRYRLEVGRCADFSRPGLIPTDGETAEAYFVPTEDCPTAYFFRVRAERRGEVSAWSNTRAAVIPPEPFELCGALAAGIADLVLSVAAGASPDLDDGLAWDYEDLLAFDASDTYELQLSYENGFEAPVTIPDDAEGYDPGERTYFPGRFHDATRYFRVRVVRDGRKGVWSNTVALHPSARAGWTLQPAAEYESDNLLAVHRALIRFCAARADAVAVLTLPRTYREAETTRHVGDLLPQLRPRRSSEGGASNGGLDVPALTRGEERALSYAALYHPWVATAEAEPATDRRGALRTVWQPPDGAASGRIAARTLRLGAWVAPANEPIAAAIAHEPVFEPEAWARLTDAQCNLILRDPRGFLISNAETLGRRDDLRPLNVRRLMILLRRLALGEGATFVFEPHDHDFRGRVRQRFERALSGMYQRGAFAGATPAAGFRVVVDESVNPPRAVELGRFAVELRVAPSQPFRYLTVRLEQAGPETLAVTEI